MGKKKKRGLPLPPPPPPPYSWLESPPKAGLSSRLMQRYRATRQVKRGCILLVAAATALLLCAGAVSVAQLFDLFSDYYATQTAEVLWEQTQTAYIAFRQATGVQQATSEAISRQDQTAQAAMQLATAFREATNEASWRQISGQTQTAEVLSRQAQAARQITALAQWGQTRTVVALTPSSTPIPTPTATRTPGISPLLARVSMTPTGTLFPTRTPLPTATPARWPTVTRAPLPTRTVSTGVTVKASGIVNLRGGPGTNYPVVGTLAAGQVVRAEARNGDWLYLGNTRWVAAWVVTVTGNVTSLPTRTAPPAPAAPAQPAQPAVPTTAPRTSSCPSLSYTCSQLTCQQAYACLAAGNRSLDRDGDGVPCESICPGG